MSDLLFHHARLVLPDRVLEDGVIHARDGRIAYAGKPRARLAPHAVEIDAKGGILAPGFVDIHVHGGAGADFMDGTEDAVRTANRCHARHGTTTVFPTTTTGSPRQIMDMLRACGGTRRAWSCGDGARIAGVHLYGPFFAADKVGCHAPEGRRDPAPKEYAPYFATGLVRIATCAAELPGAQAFYRAAARKRCLVTCGHSNASWTEMTRAFRAGMRHVDHFWCAMSSVASLRPRFGTPMQAGMEQFVLAHDEMSTEVIADGCHLSDELLRFAWRMKGAARLCLVTDSSRALDMPKGKYRFGSAQDGPWFVHDGEVGRSDDGVGLASSTAGMDRMVQTMTRATKAPLHEVIRMASLTPAERAGIAHECGSLERGKRADVLVLDGKLRVKRVFIAGEEHRLKPPVKR
ncbi:MAG TPA: amidohydrolase family protein [Verrucomicrobiaceae bacterium]|jgi:N-acetylglucosamine-6-phosphate deacetylase